MTIKPIYQLSITTRAVLIKFFTTLAVAFSLLTNLTGCGNAPNKSQQKSLPPNGSNSGRWLATISVGGGIAIDGTLTLRTFLADIFTASQGGSYKHIIDLDDVNPHSRQPTVDEFRQSIAELANEVAKFRIRFPADQTMVIIGLTGHGSTGTDKNNYTFKLSNGVIGGDELVQLIATIKADETILIMQSCFSGALTEKHFPKGAASIDKFAEQVSQAASLSSVRLGVITPVSSFIESPVYSWEEEILRPASLDVRFDLNQDGILSYGEWKNSIMYHSCSHFAYAPRSVYETAVSAKLPREGIDPSFFESHIFDSLPIIALGSDFALTESTEGTPPAIWDSTTAFCKEQADLFAFLRTGTQELPAMWTKFGKVSEISKAKILDFVGSSLKPSTPLLEFVQNQIHNSDKSTLVASEAIYAYVRLQTSENHELNWDPLLSYVSQFDNYGLDIQRAILFAASKSKNDRMPPILKQILSTSSDKLLLKNALRAISRFPSEDVEHLAKRIYETSSSDVVRSAAIETLWSIAPERHIELFRKALTSDPSPEVKITATYGCMMEPQQCAAELEQAIASPFVGVQLAVLTAVKQGNLRELAPDLVLLLERERKEMTLLILLDLIKSWHLTEALPTLKKMAASNDYSPMIQGLSKEAIAVIES